MALTDSLISYWKLDEASGTRVDSHGSNDLTDVNTVLNATGIISNAADFEKSNSETLSIADGSQSGLDFSGDHSYSFWIKFESITAGDEFFSKGAAAGQRSYEFKVLSNTEIRYQIWNTSDASVERPWTVSSMSLGTWYHLVLTFSLSGGSAILYINGSSQGTKTGFGSSIKNSTADFRIGSWGQNSNYYDGLIDEVGIWSRVLTGAEVSELYNSGAGLSYDNFNGGGAPAFIPRIFYI